MIHTIRNSRFVVTCAAALMTSLVAVGQEPPPPQPGGQANAQGENAEGEVETLLRGPLHEAFAEPIQGEPTAGVVVSKEPPEPINEIPPEARPENENAIWISGYWAFDEERDDFVWLSGVWRVPPPGQRWVPGYWAQAEGGYQWVPGFWSSTQAEEIAYLPPPPESLEQGPSSPAPSDNHYWVSGCWEYRENDYVWQPGYWTEYQEGWVWLPSHYNWTPRGVVYVNGYWDYPLSRRGQIFAPVFFHNRGYYRNPGYRYSPRVAIDIRPLLLHLFVQPRHNHYYWGDYYGGRYQRSGFIAWSNRRGRRGHDPLFSYYQTHYQRRGIDYADRLAGWNRYYERYEDRRPARTFSAQANLASRVDGDANMKYSLLGRTINDLMADDGRGQRFRRLDEQQRRSIADSSEEFRGLMKQRIQLEVNEAANLDGSNRGRADLPNADREGQGKAPRGVFKLPETRLGNRENRNRGDSPQNPTTELPERGNRNARRDADRPDDPTQPGNSRTTRKPIVPERPDRKRNETPDPNVDRPDVTPRNPRNRPDPDSPRNPRDARPDLPGRKPERPDRTPNVPEQPDRKLDVPKNPKIDRPDRAPRGRENRPGDAPGRNRPDQRPGQKRPERPERNPNVPQQPERKIDVPDRKVERPAQRETPRESRREVPRQAPEQRRAPKVERPQTPQPKFERPQTPRGPKIESPRRTPQLPQQKPKSKGPKKPKS